MYRKMIYLYILAGGGVKLTYLELAHYYVHITQMKMMMMTAMSMTQLLYIDSHPSISSMSNLDVSETLTLMMKSV